MDIGIIWALLCLLVAIACLLIYIRRRNKDEAKLARAAWQAAHPTMPKNYDMSIALLWTSLMLGAGVVGGEAIPAFVTTPNVWSGVGGAFGVFILIVGVRIMLTLKPG